MMKLSCHALSALLILRDDSAAYWLMFKKSVLQQMLEANEMKVLIFHDPMVPISYLLSDGQNMYNRVALVCAVNVYIPASLDRRPSLRYQVLHVRKNCSHL